MIQLSDDKLLIFNLLLLMSVLACEMKEILTFTAHERGKVEIRCPYKSDYKEHKKYLCRGKCQILNKDKPVESESEAEDDRFSLIDDKSAHIFTVTITDLRTEDQGKYWCGVKTGWLKFDDFTQIHLEIKPGSTAVIMVIVIGILTGFGFLLFIYLSRSKKKEGNCPSHSPTENLPNGDTGETREATHTVYDYENIGNTLDHPDYSVVLPAFAEHDASVYALAQLPNIPSDDLNYSSIKFTATPHSDKTSDGQMSCDYATVRP
ncbi:polymeric immunoglobulin receptor-like protein [Labeo rohita]|nr:polymeric immunoglobulin receptor-like protein [Labeo rohita]